MSLVKAIELVPGHLQITEENGQKRQIKLTDMLRAVDVPDLNISSLTLLTNLAQVVMVLTHTLVQEGILDENLVEGYDLQYVQETLESLNAEIGEGE